MSFTKFHSDMLDSSVWQEPIEIKIVWVTMLLMADSNGEVMAAIPGLARRAGVTIPQCEKALERLMSPDRYSRTPDEDGRRIVPIDGGWEVVNHLKYREMMSREDRAEKERLRKARYRARKKNRAAEKRPEDVPSAVPDVPRDTGHVPQCPAMSHHTEAEAEAERETPSLSPPTPSRGGRAGESVALPSSLNVAPFPEAWERWRKHLLDRGRVSRSTLEAQLRTLEPLGPKEAADRCELGIELNLGLPAKFPRNSPRPTPKTPSRSGEGLDRSRAQYANVT